MFAFRLALELGCTVGELAKRLSLDEFNEWLAYYQMEPFGSPAADIRFGAVVAAWAKDLKPGDVFNWGGRQAFGGCDEIEAAFAALPGTVYR